MGRYVKRRLCADWENEPPRERHVAAAGSRVPPRGQRGIWGGRAKDAEDAKEKLWRSSKESADDSDCRR
jgi:hypothetical protein